MKNNRAKWIGLAAAAVVTFGMIGFTTAEAGDHHRGREHHNAGHIAVEIVKAIFAPAVTVVPHGNVYNVLPPPPPPKFHKVNHHRPAPPPPPRHHHGKGGKR